MHWLYKGCYLLVLNCLNIICLCLYLGVKRLNYVGMDYYGDIGINNKEVNIMSKKIESIEATSYVHRGIMIVLRSALSTNDKDSWQSLWKAKYGNLNLFPWGELGMEKPVFICEHCGNPNQNVIVKGSQEHRDLVVSLRCEGGE